MPPRTHVAVLRGRDMTTGEPLQEVVVWAEREGEIEKLRADAAAILRADLQAALDELAEPLGDDESDQERIERLATGTEVNPGVCVEDGQWSAWAYDPAGGDDPVIVYA
jgi:hypothetical protein